MRSTSSSGTSDATRLTSRGGSERAMERVLVLPGDGIGPEVTGQAQRVLETGRIGGAAIDADGTPLSDATLALAKRCRAVLLGAVGGPAWDAMPVDRRPEKGLLRIRKE